MRFLIPMCYHLMCCSKWSLFNLLIISKIPFLGCDPNGVRTLIVGFLKTLNLVAKISILVFFLVILHLVKILRLFYRWTDIVSTK